jgi:hypothetical protein
MAKAKERLTERIDKAAKAENSHLYGKWCEIDGFEACIPTGIIDGFLEIKYQGRTRFVPYWIIGGIIPLDCEQCGKNTSAPRRRESYLGDICVVQSDAIYCDDCYEKLFSSARANAEEKRKQMAQEWREVVSTTATQGNCDLTIYERKPLWKRAIDSFVNPDHTVFWIAGGMGLAMLIIWVFKCA